MTKVYGGKGTIPWIETQKLLTKGLRLENGDVLSLVDVKDLKIDNTYQRGLVSSSVTRIYREFESNAVGIFQIGQRADTKDLNVIDGQHRMGAILKRAQFGDSSPKAVLAVVTPKTTLSQEANKFVLFNSNKPVVGSMRFRARLQTDGHPEVAIAKIAKSEGFELCFLSPGRRSSGDNGMNGIFSVTSLIRAYNISDVSLKLAFQLLREWQGKGKAHMVPEDLRDGRVIFTLTDFLMSNAISDVKSLCKKFAKYSLESAWKDSDTRKSTAPDKPTADYSRPAYLKMRLEYWLSN